MGRDKNRTKARGDRATRRPKERGRTPGPVATLAPKPAPTDWEQVRRAATAGRDGLAGPQELPKPAPAATLPPAPSGATLAPETRAVKETRQAKLQRTDTAEIRVPLGMIREMSALTGEAPDNPGKVVAAMAVLLRVHYRKP